MADEFDSLLKKINEEEKYKMRVGEDKVRADIRTEAAKAAADYADWLWHSELLKSQFKQTHEVFGKIQQRVTNWEILSKDYVHPGTDNIVERSFSTGIVKNGWRDAERVTSSKESFYSTGIVRNDLYDAERRLCFKVGLFNMYEEVKKPRDISQPMLEAEGIALFELLKQSQSAAFSADSIVSDLGKLNLEFTLERNRGRRTPDVKREVGIGFLYEHSLADTCKEIFLMINDETIDYNKWNDQLNILIPEGDYHLIKRGNRAQQLNDNTIVQNEDPKWRNG